MAFPRTFVMALVMSAGWPRQRGTFRKKLVVNGEIASGVLDQLAQSSAILGAEEPETARRLFASCFAVDKDWADPSVDELFVGFDEDIEAASAATNPIEHLVDPALRQALLSSGDFPWEGDMGFKTAPVIEQRISFACLTSLYWGLKAPDQVRAWIAAQDADRPRRLERARAAGLELDDDLTGDASEMLVSFKQILADYEDQVIALPDPSPDLVPRLS